MRQTLLTAAAAFVAGGIATGAVLSQAQSTPQPAPMAIQATDGQPPRPGMGGPGMAGPGMGRPGMMGWRHGHGGRWKPRAFALIYRRPDRQLAPGDVQKIAEGFLLWNGNHSWKVTEVGATPDGPIGFSFATSDGSVIAKFTMDPHTGRIARVG